MKYITFTVPCYNSQDYMQRCIDSLLLGGEDVEILIIDDGSMDATREIADAYERMHPGIVKAVHQENGGHGAGVNKGLELAEGLYFKVVDSDDWLDGDAYQCLLKNVKKLCGRGQSIPDLLICNYVYDHLEEGTSHTINYRNVFPVEKECTWEEMKRFSLSQYLIMHALVYRTEILRESGVRLPRHTFYVDNLFVYQPLPYVKKLYYIDVDLYHYYLGREDQSVNEKVLMQRIDQQIRVTKLVAGCVDLQMVEKQHPKLAVYMRRNISIMMAISSIHLLLIRTEEAEQKRKKLWEGIRSENRKLYYQLKYRTISGLTDLPGRVGGMLTIGGYRMAKKVYRFQ